MTRLELLYASGCALVTLPASIGGLEELHTLNAANNRLSDLPRSIRQLTQYAPNVRDVGAHHADNHDSRGQTQGDSAGVLSDSNQRLGLAARDLVAGYEM